MNKIEFLNKIEKIGISYKQFNNESAARASEENKIFTTELEQKLHSFTILNQSRTNRILKTYKPGDEIIEIVKNIKSKQTWLIITEDWCGDSAQNIPYLFKMTELNSNINFKIIYRDQHTNIIDMYLTNGGRAIPKIVGFDKLGNEIFQWGPRPEVAKNLVKKWKADGLTKEEFNKKLHLWYGKDKGKTLEKEFKKLLSSI